VTPGALAKFRGELMSPPRILLLSIFALAALAAAQPAHAERTRFWRQTNYEEFEKGTPKGVALQSDGRLVPAPRFAPFADPNLAYLWALRVDSKGRVYAAGGSNAKVVRFDEKGAATTVFESPELTAQTILLDAQDNLYVGTQPDGKVYRITPQGQQSVFFAPGTKYIWDLALGRDGTIFVATGDKGEIFAVTPDGKSKLFYKSDETHVRCLAFDGKGRMLAGTEPNGLVLRVETSKSGEAQAFVVYETAKKEVTALLSDKTGGVFVAAVGEKTPVNPVAVPPNVPPAPQVPGQVIPPQIQPAIFLPIPSLGGSEVYHIAADGAPERLWSSREDLVFSLAFSSAGKLLLGTGAKGILYQLEGSGVYSNVAKTFAAQVTALAAAPDGKIFVGSANPAKVFSMGPGTEPDGVFESQVYDARIFSRWGRLTWWGDDGATNGQVEFYLRSGNTSNPEKNWSPWAGPYRNPRGEAVDVPAARFVQWKVVFKSSAPGTNISWVSVAYLPKNVAPVIDSIIVQNPGIRAQGMLVVQPGQQPVQPVQLRLPPPPAMPGVPVFPQPQMIQPQRFDPPPQGFAQRGYQTVVWSARDENDDDLSFTVHYRGEGEKAWKLLKDRVETKFYSWDTTAMPDGAYYLKIIASDVPSNPGEDALTAERESDRFEVDNSPPEVSHLRAESTAGGVRVEFDAQDSASVISRAEYSLDGGEWKLVFPSGRLADALQQSYDFTLAAVSAGEHTIAVRVFDQFENVAASKYTFTVAEAKKR